MSVNKQELIGKINQIQGLSNDEKSALIELLKTHKKYGLVWEDKPEEVEERLREELPVLTEVKERAIISDDPDAPNHILIEGDNLEALTALSYTHAGKIDVIYIDPPYNTGKKDFKYNDSYVDAEDSFRHSKWLSFINKRLTIAKTLLSEKGVLFASIDDNEQAQLKFLLDSVFGATNFLGQLILKTATDNNPSQINIEHEYMLCYCINKEYQTNWKRTSAAAKLIQDKYEELKKSYSNPVDIQKELRKWIKFNKDALPQVAHYNNVDEMGVYSSSSNSSNPHPGGYDFDIFHPVTKLPCPKPQNGWRWPYDTFQAYNNAGQVEWGVDHSTQPHIKKRLETSTEYLRTLIYEDNRGTTKALSDMFNGTKVFDNPKPVNVLSRIFDFASCKTSCFLDFFAGSGTTLHATMKLNAEDGGHRKCILVTNNENHICEEVTYERNKRVINGYTTPKGEEVPGLTANTLRYYKTDFIGRDRTSRNMRQLVYAATDMLCIKEDIYREVKTFGSLKLKASVSRYFEEGNRRMLVIYNELAVPAFAEEISKMDIDGKVLIYVFAPGNYAYDDEFVDVLGKVDLCALPAAIYNAYQKVLPKRRTKFLDGTAAEGVSPELGEDGGGELNLIFGEE